MANNAEMNNNLTDGDAEMARRVEMEMKDQMYAIQLQAYEQSLQQQRAMQGRYGNNGHPGRSPADIWRMQQAERSRNGW